MNPIHCTRRRVSPPLALLALAGGVALGGTLAGTAAAQEATPGVLADPPATIDCEASLATQVASPEETFTIVGEESAARYRAQEELANVGAAEAVGETNAIIGTILFDAEGLPRPCSRFDVDLRTLQSDSARRDNYLYENTLQTGEFPLATFVLTAVEGLDGPLAEGEETAFTLIGNLTLRDVTKLVAWEATATLDGDALTGNAATAFDMPDFAIEPPVVGPVVSLDERVALEVELTAERAS
jgi:polyisoprenoid-binding protein YceI